MNDVPQVMAFVGVHPAGQHQHAVRADADRQHVTGVPDRGRRRESRQVGHRQYRGRAAQRGDGRRPPRTQDDRDVVLGDLGDVGDELRSRPCERVGVWWTGHRAAA